MKETQAKQLLEHFEDIPQKEEDNLEKYIAGDIQEEIIEDDIIFEAKLMATEDGISTVDDILEEFIKAKPARPNIHDNYDKPFFVRTEEVLRNVAEGIVKPKVDGFESQMALFRKTAKILIKQKQRFMFAKGLKRGIKDKWMMEVIAKQVFGKFWDEDGENLMEELLTIEADEAIQEEEEKYEDSSSDSEEESSSSSNSSVENEGNPKTPARRKNKVEEEKVSYDKNLKRLTTERKKARETHIMKNYGHEELNPPPKRNKKIKNKNK